MNPVGEWARLLVDALFRAGVTDVFVSPGSRSTPFVVLADAHEELRVHDVIDERAAGFCALGHARVTGRPAAVLCTSGTAGAHYLPAAIEASLSHLPMVILTADRPVALHQCGANQTVDQLGFFAPHGRFVADLGLPDIRGDALRAMRRMVARAVATSVSPTPGPVHLNARAEKPLEPAAPVTVAEREAEEVARAVGCEPMPRFAVPRAALDAAVLDEIAHRMASAKRGIVVAGPMPPTEVRLREPVFELCRRTGFALFAEATSQLRFAGRARNGVLTVDAFDALLRTAHGRRSLAPDLVIQLGAFPTSKGYELLVTERPDIDRVVLAAHGWPDPVGTASIVANADLLAALEGIAARVPQRAAPPPGSALDTFEARAWGLVEAELAGVDRAGLGEGAVARTVVSSLPPGALLAVGNSLPVRELDAFCRGDAVDVIVASQRGASGIDGLVAGAVGSARASRRPTALYLGDVSFLHDQGGLATARALDVPLAIVVANNGGGRIFEQLPIASGASERTLERFTTPHDVDLSSLARAYRHRFARVERASALSSAIAEALDTPGATLIEAVVPSHAAREETARLAVAMEALVREVWP